jgi:hypothetical protein
VKSHHAAALALVGWYLMCPPLQSPCWPGVETLRELFGKGPNACKNLYPDYDAALSQWKESRKFDHADECQADVTKDLKDWLSRKTPLSDRIHCRCVATDDPRLKSK